MARGVVGLEHGVEDTLDEADLVRRVDRCHLREVIAVGVDQSVDAASRGLMEGASDFEIEGGDSIVGR